ncbi:MAG: DUF481 domain-containing protein [Planctomycetota bacterium]|jgi:putative salt-induced outer membrane protein
MRHLIALLLIASLAQAETLGEAVRSYLAAAETAKTGPWEVTGALGITYTDGVTDTTSISVGVDALGEWTQWKVTIRWLSTYTETEGTVAANEHILVTRGDYKLSDRASIFGSLLLEYDEIEGVEPRIQFVLGYDRRLVKKETFELLGNLGGGVLYEKYPAGGSTTDAIAQAGVDWTWQITKQLTYTQVLRFLPNLRRRIPVHLRVRLQHADLRDARPAPHDSRPVQLRPPPGCGEERSQGGARHRHPLHEAEEEGVVKRGRGFPSP